MTTKIFMLYGAHDIKVMYGMKNFKNCVKQFKRIVRQHKLKYENIISILEGGTIFSINIGIDAKKSPEDYVIKKTELEKKALKIFLKNKETVLSKIIEIFKPKNESYYDFQFQLSLFLKRKNVMMVFEDNNSEVIKKEIEYENKSKAEILDRVFSSSHDGDNLRDKLMVNQIQRIIKNHSDKYFVIVRGSHHNKLSDYLRKTDFEVLDYKY